MHRCFWLARSSQGDRLSNPDRSRQTNGPLLCFVWGYRAGQGVEYAKVYHVIAICWVCERRQSGILFWSLIKCQSLSTLTDLISLLLDATEAAFPHWSPVLNMMPYWRASSDWLVNEMNGPLTRRSLNYWFNNNLRPDLWREANNVGPSPAAVVCRAKPNNSTFHI